MTVRISALILSAWLGLSAAALAGPILELDARVQSTLNNDELSVVLVSEREGPQVGPVNETVLAQVNAALAQARAVEGVQARLGSVQTIPNFAQDGGIQSWRVRGAIVLESTKLAALSQLTGRLAATMHIENVAFRVSDARRQAEQQKLVKTVAQAFRERAALAATAFGFTGYEIKTLTLRPQSIEMPAPRMVAMRMTMPESNTNLPTDAGESDIEVSVAGTIELR